MMRSEPQIEVAPFVEGAFVRSVSDASFDVVDPSTGRPRLKIPAGSEKDAERAIASARRAFEDGRWSEAAPSFRKGVMHRWADLIASHATELDVLDAGEMGKPISVAFCNAAGAATLMRFCAEAIDKVLGDVFSSDKTSFVAQRRVPRGVIAAIVPWNFPTYNAVLKIAPALAAGDCVVLKPSELSSCSAIRLAQLAVEAGLPPGVLNVVPGLGDTVGRTLGLHFDVDMIAFTGSTAVGKQMLRYAGESNMKAVMTECGGKCPQIIFGDGVDLDAACNSVADLLLTNQGQICSVGSRLLVQRSVESQVVERIRSRVSNVVIGSALEPSTTFGPVVSAKQCTRVMTYIKNAAAEGAHLVTGGRRALLDSGGFFIEPTVFRNVSPSSQIAQQEIFGPVLSVIAFDSIEHAIRIANDTAYGLMAYVWTASLSTGLRMMKGIRSSVMINAAAPIGEGPGHAYSHEPTRQSGLGTESGMSGIESYLRRQLTWFNHG